MDNLTPEQIEELKQSAEQLETLKAEYATQQAELEKLKGKDYNFRKLEESTEIEKEKSKKQVAKKESELTEQEKRLQEMEEGFKTRQDEFFASQLTSAKERVLKDLAGDDVDLREKMEVHAKSIIGDMNNEEQIRDKYTKAFILETGSRPQLNPVAAVQGVNSGYSRAQPKKFTETEQGKAAYDTYFPDLKGIRNK